MSHITNALPIIAGSFAIAAIQMCAAPTGAIRPRCVLITFADTLNARTTAGAVFRAALERAIPGERAAPALVTYACAVSAVAMSTAAVFANSQACLASKTLVALADANVCTLACTIAVAISRTNLLLAVITSVTFSALAHVVGAFTNRVGAVALAVGNFASSATETTLAETGSRNTLTLAIACGWAKLLASWPTVA